MKYLQTLCEQTQLSLELSYYLPYLNTREEVLLKAAVEKNSEIYSLNLLKAFALKILFFLQHSDFLWGESYWQSLLKKSQSALAAQGEGDHLRTALQQTDAVISAASVAENVRHKIESKAKNRGLLTKEQACRYESIRQEFIIRHESLNSLENTIETTLQDTSPFIRKLSPSSPIMTPDAPQFSSSLRPYDMKMVQARFSKEHIHHQIQREGDALTVYHHIAKELGQKPMAEKVAEDVQKAKTSLQRRAEQLEQKIENHRQKISQNTRFTIEQRTQVALAHANRIEQIALTLAAIIHTLQSCCPSHCRPLLNLMAEAKSLQKNLNRQKESQLFQDKLLVMNSHRCTYEKSITSIRSILFPNSRQLQQQKLNRDLQTQLAELVTPICGFNDKNTAVTPERAKHLKAISDKLVIHQGYLIQEQNKINQIKNIAA